MTFEITRTSDPLCEPTCLECIYTVGMIERGTPARFRKFLKTLGTRHLAMIITSSGGDTGASLVVGREVRKHKLNIAVGEADVCHARKRSQSALNAATYLDEMDIEPGLADKAYENVKLFDAPSICNVNIS